MSIIVVLCLKHGWCVSEKWSIMGGGYSYFWNNPHIGLYMIELIIVMSIGSMTSYQRWVALYMGVLPYHMMSIRDNMYQIKLIFVVKCEMCVISFVNCDSWFILFVNCEQTPPPPPFLGLYIVWMQ